jgi:hypothetical protein
MSKTPDGKEPTPVATPAVRKIGTAKGDFKTPDSFDAPLPDHVLDEFEA